MQRADPSPLALDLNNEGETQSSTFSNSTGNDSSDKFDSEGASYATSGGQSGAGGLGSSGKYSSATDDSSCESSASRWEFLALTSMLHRTDNDRSEGRGAQSSSGSESRSQGRETGRQMNDEYASMSGEAVRSVPHRLTSPLN